MPFKNVKSYFVFTSAQRTGLLLLFVLIILIQAFLFFVDFSTEKTISSEEKQWLSLQTQVDSLKKNQSLQKFRIYPFNPNFITDYKGYQLGMSVEEIDRLLEFRSQNRFVNSAEEFQNVTKVSDSLLAKISPYFKFPDWVNKRKSTVLNQSTTKKVFDKKPSVVLKDINQATAEDLIKVYGVGPVLSERILRERNKLGSFVDMEQLAEIWGLSEEVVVEIKRNFTVLSKAEIKKVNINEASVKELSNFPYFKYALAKEIVIFRSMNGGIKNAEDLEKINGFPINKIKTIALYLDF